MIRRKFLAVLASAPLAGSFFQGRPWQIQMVGAREAGTRIRVAGIVFGPDGSTPAANVRMFLYQTDAAGWYVRPTNNPRQSRLRGTLWTDRNGRYEFLSVQPGHYADVSPPPPMHIHVHLEPPGLPTHWVDSFQFRGDARLRPTDVERHAGTGRYSGILTLSQGSDGILQGSRDFRIDPALAERNRLVNGWYRE